MPVHHGIFNKPKGKKNESTENKYIKYCLRLIQGIIMVEMDLEKQIGFQQNSSRTSTRYKYFLRFGMGLHYPVSMIYLFINDIPSRKSSRNWSINISFLGPPI